MIVSKIKVETMLNVSATWLESLGEGFTFWENLSSTALGLCHSFSHKRATASHNLSPMTLAFLTVEGLEL